MAIGKLVKLFLGLDKWGGFFEFVTLMATPKGTRVRSIVLNDTDAVHIYTEPSKIWLQLRRNFPTELDIGTPSFKTAFQLSTAQALEIAGELLAVVHGRLGCAMAAQTAGAEARAEKSALEIVPAKSEKAWTPEEDKRLLSRHSSKLPVEEIAKKHKRSVESVQARLVELGKG